MHILQALVSLNLGGSEMVAVETTEYLRSMGHRVTVVAAHGPLSGRVSNCGAAVLDWPIGKKRLSTLSLIKRLRHWLAENRVDIVHVHSRLPAWICYLAMRKLPKDQRPVLITSVHGQYSVSFYSAIMARGDWVIAVSNHIRNYTLKNYLPEGSPRLRTIYGGTAQRDFPFGFRPSDDWFKATFAEFPQLENKRILLLPGRLSRYKGHATFIELFAALEKEFEDIHAVILGRAKPGSRYINELEGLAERYGITEKLTFCGARTDMREWMSASSIVFNLCSDPPEAFGRTIPEALSLGVPAIGWDHGGVAEVLSVMFPAGAVEADNYHELLDRTREFLLNRPQVTRNETFSLQSSMQKTLELYRDALKEDTP